MGDQAPYIPEEDRAELILPRGGRYIADLTDESQILWLIRELLDWEKRNEKENL
jgi:hypothetical protein